MNGAKYGWQLPAKCFRFSEHDEKMVQDRLIEIYRNQSTHWIVEISPDGMIPNNYEQWLFYSPDANLDSMFRAKRSAWFNSGYASVSLELLLKQVELCITTPIGEKIPLLEGVIA